jgi:hypothetical protein
MVGSFAFDAARMFGFLIHEIDSEKLLQNAYFHF